MSKQEPITIGGVWLQSDDNDLVVLVERDGVWYEAIRTFAPLGEMTVSHAVSPLGMRAAPLARWEQRAPGGLSDRRHSIVGD